MSELPSGVWFLIMHHSEQSDRLLKQIRCICLSAYNACAYYMRIVLQSRLHFSHRVSYPKPISNWSVQLATKENQLIKYDKQNVHCRCDWDCFEDSIHISISVRDLFTISREDHL